MLGEPDGTTSSRVRHLQGVLKEAGFPTLISADIEDWLVAHAAFVVPIAFALYRVGGDPARLAADPVTMRLMVRATRQAFTALRADGNAEIPTNLRILYRLPTRVVIGYWRRVLNSPRGELWFGAHSRAAPEEMRDLADQLQRNPAPHRAPHARPRHVCWPPAPDRMAPTCPHGIGSPLVPRPACAILDGATHPHRRRQSSPAASRGY